MLITPQNGHMKLKSPPAKFNADRCCQLRIAEDRGLFEFRYALIP